MRANRGRRGSHRLRVAVLDGDAALGEALCHALGRLGTRVVCFGSRPVPTAEFVPGRREDPSALAELRGRFDAAIDFGARGFDGPAAVAAALHGRVGLMVQLGTWRVYAGAVDAPDCRGGQRPGGGMPRPCPEDAPLRDGIALASEDGLWNARAAGAFPATLLRLAPLYGPGVGLAREWHVVERLRAGRTRIALPDGGGQLLHRLFVDNAVHAIVCALDHPREADGHSFNVGDGDVPTLAELCQECARALERPLEGVPLPLERFDGRHPWATPAPVLLDTFRLRARLGYRDAARPREGLARTARWLWDLPGESVPTLLGPYLARWGCGHDHAAEAAAIAGWCAAGGSRRPAGS